MQQQTTVIVKPDMVLRGEETVKQIRARYKAANLIIVEEVRLKFTLETAGKFYAEHREKPWFEGLTLGMASGPSVAWKLAGEDAVDRVRELNGATDPRQAKPGTIREIFRSAGGPFNSVHGSKSEEEAEREWKVVVEASKNQKTKGYSVGYRPEYRCGSTVGMWVPAERYKVDENFFYFFKGSSEEVTFQIPRGQVQYVSREDY